jgi:hypothetical protein
MSPTTRFARSAASSAAALLFRLLLEDELPLDDDDVLIWFPILTWHFIGVQ